MQWDEGQQGGCAQVCDVTRLLAVGT